jgi:transcriptional regulator with XRE-family HTH domain
MATNPQLRAEIREFLVSRRARITPEQAGLLAFGTSRRVKGLRREEVATLAGVSAEYYTRVERGTVTGVSESVLNGIAHALQLDEAERAHLTNLVRAAGTIRPAPRRPATPRRVRPTVQRILDSMVLTPALVVDSRLDILAGNKLGEALYAPIFADPARPPNQARFLFLDPHASDFWRDWATNADDAVALLRASAGRDPYDRRLTDLVGELATRSEDFRTRWASHDVRSYVTGHKRIHHPLVGDLELPFETSSLGADPGQHLLLYTAEPDSRSHEALKILASWTTPAQQLDASVPGPSDTDQSQININTSAQG